ncbi:hypothetical protein GN330_12185 [Nitratireductor sp. CAU 1489]|uniref:Uncharacterized protein n=1 Tax=Nitratireductor arenosus TaxID=2682096 RepID=A0A844QJ07_9HYPH|nr:hypothetical protein [Nitratireductor arenosus]MVA98003.1 hypothetical protein [Nitratireductor arenosus]
MKTPRQPLGLIGPRPLFEPVLKPRATLVAPPGSGKTTCVAVPFVGPGGQDRDPGVTEDHKGRSLPTSFVRAPRGGRQPVVFDPFYMRSKRP